MKKFLSLVLALVMTMSLVTVSAGAKDFTDSCCQDHLQPDPWPHHRLCSGG